MCLGGRGLAFPVAPHPPGLMRARARVISGTGWHLFATHNWSFLSGSFKHQETANVLAAMGNKPPFLSDSNNQNLGHWLNQNAPWESQEGFFVQGFGMRLMFAFSVGI